jgi:hypothetical protein
VSLSVQVRLKMMAMWLENAVGTKVRIVSRHVSQKLQIFDTECYCGLS